MIKVKNFITKMSHSPNSTNSRNSFRGKKPTPSPYEATSEKIELLLNSGDIRTAVAVISTMQAEYLLKCMSIFPLKSMKQLLPKTLPIWEVLLDKINDIEDGSIPQAVYAVYDSLVLHCAHRMSYLQASPIESNGTELPAINQLLRKVYLQYPEIVERFNALLEQTTTALHSLNQHFPLQLESSVTSLQEAIRDEIRSSVLDFQESLENLNKLTAQEKFSLAEMLISGQPSNSQGSDSSPSPPPIAPSLSQIQMQERLYFNQAVLRTIQPTRRSGNLAVLSELLMHRIVGDKEVLSLFGSLRKELEIGDDVPVETCLKQHRQSLDLVTVTLRKIKVDVDGECESPVDLNNTNLLSSGARKRNGVRHASLGDFSDDNKRSFGASALFSSQDRSTLSIDSLGVRGNLSPVNNGLNVRSLEKGLCTSGYISISGSSITSKSNPGLYRPDSGEAPQNFNGVSGKSIHSSAELSCLQELEQRKTELHQAQDMIQHLKYRERDLTERLSEQARKHLESSTIFEDLSLGANRPTQLIRRYQELYSQGRVDVIEAIEELGVEDQSFAFPLDIIQVSFAVVESTLQEITLNWKKALFFTEQASLASAASTQLEKAVSTYLRKECNPHKLPILQAVETKLWNKHSVPEAVKSSNTVKNFIRDCVQLAWVLAVQNNQMTISCKETVFVTDFHNRFYSANPENHRIKAYVWPILLQLTSESQNVLFKGVVVT